MGTPTVKHVGAIVFIIALSSFLATLNETILNVALNPLMNSFSIDYSTVQWVVTLNMLVIAIMIPLAGFLNRILPTRTLVIGSLSITLIGTIIGALAPSYPLLLVARIIQAAGTGITMPVTMALTLAIAPKNKLGTYMGIVSVLTTLGPSFGPIAAGFTLAVTDDWHTLFILFGVLVLICLIGAIIFIPNASELDHPHLDMLSVVEVTIALVGIMYGITALFGGDAGIGVVCLVVGCIALILFVHRQKTIQNPLIDLRPFSQGGFRLGCLMMSMAFMTTFSMNIILPLFLQGAMGKTAFAAALILLPATLFSAVASPLGGRIFDRFGIRILVPLAFLLIVVGTFSMAQIDAMTSTIAITLIFIPIVIGTGLGTSPSQSFALSRLSHETRNHGVTIVSTCLQIAGCIGSSMFVGIMSALENYHMGQGTESLVAQSMAFDGTCYVVFALGICGVLLAIYTGVKVTHKTPGYTEPEDILIPQGGSAFSLDAILGSDHWSVPQSASIFEALSVMAEHHTGGIPILDTHEHIVGFLTDGDIIRYLAGGDPRSSGNSLMYAWWRNSTQIEKDLADLQSVNVMQLASKNVISMDAHTGVEDLIKALSDVRVKRIPITQDDRYIGVLHRYDLLTYLRDIAQKTPLT